MVIELTAAVRMKQRGAIYCCLIQQRTVRCSNLDQALAAYFQHIDVYIIQPLVRGGLIQRVKKTMMGVPQTIQGKGMGWKKPRVLAKEIICMKLFARTDNPKLIDILKPDYRDSSLPSEDWDNAMGSTVVIFTRQQRVFLETPNGTIHRRISDSPAPDTNFRDATHRRGILKGGPVEPSGRYRHKMPCLDES